MQLLKNTLDYNAVRTSLVRAIEASTGLSQNNVITLESEHPDAPRPCLPYMALKITVAGARYGDDTKTQVLDSEGAPTTVVASSGPRKMTVVFNSFGRSHEEAYNLMALWQAGLDEETVQEYLRDSGISVLIIGSVVDLSILLNTGYEGRANMDCQFGLVSNVTSDLGAIEHVVVDGAVDAQGVTQNLNVTI